MFGESLEELREVQKRFHDTAEAVDGLAKTEPGQSALIPLAESVRFWFRIALLFFSKFSFMFIIFYSFVSAVCFGQDC